MTTGDRISHYQLGPRLGAGGMGEVYRATDTRTGHPVAVKLIHPELLRDPEALGRARSELQALLRLRSHPHIITVLDFVQSPFAIVTELLEGVTLDDVLVDNPRPPLVWIVRHYRDILRAVAFAHNEGILHRDLKPANVMLTQLGREQVVKVLDFGLARLGNSTRLTRPGDRMGTVHFMAPEQHQGEETDTRTDVYALGVLLHTLCTGQPPFMGLRSDFAIMKAHIETPLPPLAEHRPDLPAWLGHLIQRATAKHPAHRFESAQTLLEAFEDGGVSAAPLPKTRHGQMSQADLATMHIEADGTLRGLVTDPGFAAVEPPRPPPVPDVIAQPRRPVPPGTAGVPPALASDSNGAARRRQRVLIGAAAGVVVLGVTLILTLGFDHDSQPKTAQAAPATAAPATEPPARQPAAVPPLERPNPAGIEWVGIEGGPFEMGSENGDDDEKPVRTVRVPTFELGKTEVTFGQWAKCVSRGPCAPIDFGGCSLGDQVGKSDDHPVVCVTWEQARTFAEWAGGRLPSEAEWEYAARSGGRDRKYRWGDATATCEYAVMDDGGNGCGQGNSAWKVCSKPRGNTKDGLCDMAGNVWEWVEDVHGPYREAPTDGSARTRAGPFRVYRGGSWFSDAAHLRAAGRNGVYPGYRSDGLGFRLAR